MTKKVNILYVHPIKSPPSSLYCLMPVGIIALANLLIRKGYSVYGINPGIEKSLEKNYELQHDLKSLNYDLLMLDLHWYEHSYAAVEITRLSKRLFPGKPIIIGGFTTTIFASEILENFIEIDYAIKGDSEGPLMMLTDYIIKGSGRLEDIPNLCYRRTGKIINKDITYHCENIDQLDFITVDFLKNNRYFYFLMESGLILSPKHYLLCIARGCLYNCSYCSGSKKNSMILFGRDHFIFRTPEAVANDLEKLYKKGIKKISLTHDLKLFGDNYYKKLFSIIKAKKINIGINLGCCQLPSKEFFIDVINTFNLKNTQVNMAPYTGDEEVRRLNGKNFSNSDLIDLLQFMAENLVKVHMQYALNVNNEKADSFKKTLVQIQDIFKFYPKYLLTIFCDRVFLDPLAPYRDHIKCKLNSFMDYYHYCKNNDETYVGYSDQSTKNLNEKIRMYKQFQKKLIEN